MGRNKMKRYNFRSAVIALTVIASIYTSSFSQESREIEITAQSILARADKIMEYPRGLITGKMKHIRPDGKSYTINITGYISREDFLFVFSSRERGEQLKVLYNLGGEDIWVYDIHAIKLFNKKGIDKYDSILYTNYFFIDLSNADLQSNYTANIMGNALIKGYESYKLKLIPIFKGHYGMLTLYVSKDDFIPLRIDYHDRDNAIFKFMTISKTTKRKGKIIPVRYDMMNIRKGTMTILNFFDFEEDARFDKEIFRSEKLGG